MWFLYMVKCADGSLYTGITTNLKRRLKEHNHSSRGAKYTKTRRPVELAYHKACDSRRDAIFQERALKKKTRQHKLALVRKQKEGIIT